MIQGYGWRMARLHRGGNLVNITTLPEASGSSSLLHGNDPNRTGFTGGQFTRVAPVLASLPSEAWRSS